MDIMLGRRSENAVKNCPKENHKHFPKRNFERKNVREAFPQQILA